MTPRFGIGVTTRNRSQVLAHTLRQIRMLTPEPYRLVVVNDASEDGTADILSRESAGNAALVAIDSPTRLGIAKAKNRCLHALAGAEVLFLLDDDCYPIREGWVSLYARAIAETGVQHFNFHDPCRHRLLKRTEIAGHTVCEYEPPGGVLMVMSDRVLDTVGAFNESYGLYGFEHETYTDRSFRAGLHAGLGRNLSLQEAESYLLALDYRPEDGPFPELVRPNGFQSSVTLQEARSSIRRNARRVARDRQGGPIYLPFDNQPQPEVGWWDQLLARFAKGQV